MRRKTLLAIGIVLALTAAAVFFFSHAVLLIEDTAVLQIG